MACSGCSRIVALELGLTGAGVGLSTTGVATVAEAADSLLFLAAASAAVTADAVALGVAPKYFLISSSHFLGSAVFRPPLATDSLLPADLEAWNSAATLTFPLAMDSLVPADLGAGDSVESFGPPPADVF